jgi:phosphoglycerate dehydrogenase-like enzyme
MRAALDVTDPEPLPRDDRLWRAPNLLLTPHMAGDTPRRYRRSWQLVGEQVERLLAGKPLENVVTRSPSLARSRFRFLRPAERIHASLLIIS